jgi:hypothetical protein
MSTVIDYIDQKRAAAGIKSHAELARRAWPTLDPQKAGAYWKRLRNASGYEKPQRLQYEDLKSLCSALGLDVVRVQIELDQLERERERESLKTSP